MFSITSGLHLEICVGIVLNNPVYSFVTIDYLFNGENGNNEITDWSDQLKKAGTNVYSTADR